MQTSRAMVSIIVNNSVDPEEFTNDDDSQEELLFTVEDLTLEKGQEYLLKFTGANFEEILAYQFTFDFDPESLEYVDFEKGSLPDMKLQNIGLILCANGFLVVPSI